MSEETKKRIKKVGIMLISLGVILVAVGIYTIVSFPLSDYPAMTSGARWFLSGEVIIEVHAVQRMIFWTLLTVFILLANLFITGIALIAIGYTLYHIKV